MGEGKTVRQAFDGPDIDHDTLISRASRHNDEDAERASSAGETRADIGNFLEDTGLNSKAYSVLRQIMKVAGKSQDKAMDIIRSLKTGLPMVESHVAGQSTTDMFDGNPPEEKAEEEAPTDVADEADDPETEEFNAAVDDAMGETVVPINLS